MSLNPDELRGAEGEEYHETGEVEHEVQGHECYVNHN